MSPEPSDETVVNSNVSKEPSKETPRDPKEEQIGNLNAALRSERSQLKDLRKEIDTLKNSQLEEQGKFKELYETQKTEFEALKSQVGEYDSYFSAAVEEAKGNASQQVIDLLPSNLKPRDQLSWLSKASETFSVTNKESPTPRPSQPIGMLNPPDDGNRVNVTKEEFEKMDPIERIKYLPNFVSNEDPLAGLGR